LQRKIRKRRDAAARRKRGDPGDENSPLSEQNKKDGEQRCGWGCEGVYFSLNAEGVGRTGARVRRTSRRPLQVFTGYRR